MNFVRFCLTIKKNYPDKELRVLSLDGQTPCSIIYEPEEGQKSPTGAKNIQSPVLRDSVRLNQQDQLGSGRCYR